MSTLHKETDKTARNCQRTANELLFYETEQEAHGPYRSPEYQRLYTDFLSEGLIFVYQQPHHRINENQRWYRKAASLSLNTIAINVLYIDRVEDNTYSL